MKMISRIVIAAGGTGGHIFPAIAVADELKKENNNIDIRFIGAKGKIEEELIPKRGYKLKTIEVRGFRRSISFDNMNVILKLRKAIKESKKFLIEYKPEIVLGTGGFVSGPVLWASQKMGIPTVIIEGNYYPGITVRLLSKRIDKVILNFEATKNYLKRQDNVEIISYPVRENLKRYPRTEACEYFKLTPNKKVLFILGGSQGANSINKVMMDNYDKLISQEIQIIWQTGQRDYEKIVQITKGLSGIKAVRFIDNIDVAFSAADLIVCRSGISTLMELAYFGAAAIFIPYAFATENHQEKNARAIVEAKGAEMILDKDINTQLIDKIVSLIIDDTRLEEMRSKISKFADGDAASKIVQLLYKTAKLM